jgi:hypothetical protein
MRAEPGMQLLRGVDISAILGFLLGFFGFGCNEVKLVFNQNKCSYALCDMLAPCDSAQPSAAHCSRTQQWNLMLHYFATVTTIQQDCANAHAYHSRTTITIWCAAVPATTDWRTRGSWVSSCQQQFSSNCTSCQRGLAVGEHHCYNNFCIQLLASCH